MDSLNEAGSEIQRGVLITCTHGEPYAVKVARTVRGKPSDDLPEHNASENAGHVVVGVTALLADLWWGRRIRVHPITVRIVPP